MSEKPCDFDSPLWVNSSYETAFLIGFPDPRSTRRKDRIKSKRRYLRRYLRMILAITQQKTEHGP